MYIIIKKFYICFVLGIPSITKLRTASNFKKKKKKKKKKKLFVLLSRKKKAQQKF